MSLKSPFPPQLEHHICPDKQVMTNVTKFSISQWKVFFSVQKLFAP